MLGPMAARMYFHLFQQVKVGKPKGSGGQANSLLIEFRCDNFLGEDDMTFLQRLFTPPKTIMTMGKRGVGSRYLICEDLKPFETPDKILGPQTI